MNKFKRKLLMYLLTELTTEGIERNNNQLVDCIIVIMDEINWGG